MASETNELTFVRCPTCRSLVPASAARCRICNAALEAGGGKVSATETPNPAGRVRQKTVAAGPEEVQSMVNQTPPAAEPPARETPVREAPVRAAPKQAQDDDAFDPLGAFLQELDSPEPAEPVKQAAAPQAKADPVSDLFDDDDDNDDELDDEDDDLDDFDIDIFDDPAFEELGESKSSDPLGLEDTGDDDEEELEDFAAPPPPPPPPTQAKPVQEKAAPIEPPRQREPEQKPRSPQPPRQQTVLRTEPARKPEPPKQEVREAERAVREQPRQPEAPRKPQQPQQAAPQAGQGGFKPKLGNQPQRQEMKQPKAPEQPVREQPAREKPQQPVPQGAANFKGAGEAREQHNQRPTPPPAPPRNEPRREQQQPAARSEAGPAAKHEPRHHGRHEQHHEHRDAPAHEVSSGNGPRMGKMRPGRLFGWLVSYESPDGRAIELRAGRFFITATSIRGSDLILEDQSISTPHALISITERGLLLQDLMSERGTFVRAKGEAQYRREEGVIEVQHGDWIRFGDVEFLVTIVPG